MNRLRQMSLFAHIVECGSITAAADALDLSKSVVSQHLKSLEQELGVSLLKRTTRRQTLTVAGESFYAGCRSLNQVADSAWQNAQQGLTTPKGSIRITAPNALMETLISPAIAQVMQQYPLLVPELISSDEHLDLIAENIDLAIRVGHSRESSLKQRRIGEFRDVLCATPNVVAAFNADTTPYIANSWQSKQIHHILESASLGDIELKCEAKCITNSFYTCVSLIKADAGVGLVPDFHLGTLAPMLVTLFPQHVLPINPIYALHSFNHTPPLSVSVCLDAIERQLSQTAGH
ncbi:LysR family transcriptional regulator [Vibrio sinensis]|uniref:LysR family transcriptional regulator n=1 Tax=Vibrio sinensis TaxID=2302434 RepID=A0A3A6QKC7_9VIBR|nr:LysR substrate-binding domain-containing protein [Vibrio sinensis]RJX72973.1 LysR family transcriptional regulator [Vibrio sinensis]